MADEVDDEIAREGGAKRIALVVIVMVVVAALAGTVGFLAQRVLDDATPSAAGTTATASLDDIVPGEGARADSAHVPGVGVDYPDTCVGAAQAAGGWSTQVFGVAQAAAGVSPEAFSDLVLDEILSASVVTQDGDPVMLTARTADLVAAAEAGGQPTPHDVAEFDRGGFRLVSCTAGAQAVVTVIGTVLTDDWSYSRVDGTVTTSEEPWRDLRAFTYHLVSQDGSWRVQQVVDDRDALAALTAFGAAYVAAGYEMTGDVRSSLKSDLGVGGHLYVTRS